jgi:hypothetical protein
MNISANPLPQKKLEGKIKPRGEEEEEETCSPRDVVCFKSAAKTVSFSPRAVALQVEI